MFSVDHLAIAVKDLDTATRFYQDVLGLTLARTVSAPHLDHRTAIFPVGGTALELIQPTKSEGLVARHLKDRGEGVYLIALGVDDLSSAIRTMESAGAPFAEKFQAPTTGRKWAYVGGDSAFGVNVSLIEGKPFWR